jgi:ABC-type iron transport system FetAB permease component
MYIRWSVGIEAEGDRIMKREEVVELADAVAGSSGIATGIGTNRYGAQIIVFADTREHAIKLGQEKFAEAVKTAGLPVFEIVRVEAVSEDEELDDLET